MNRQQDGLLKPLSAGMSDRVSVTILEAAQRLYAKDGLAVTEQDVADAARTTVAEIRKRFVDADGLLIAALSMASRGMGERVLAAGPQRGWGALRLMPQGMAALNRLPGFLQFYLDMMVLGLRKKHVAHDWTMYRHELSRDFIRDAIESGIEDGEIDPSIDVMLATRWIMGLYPGVYVWAAEGRPYRPEEPMEKLIDLLESMYRIPRA